MIVIPVCGTKLRTPHHQKNVLRARALFQKESYDKS